MSKSKFQFHVKEFFKLSTGTTAIVGLMEPTSFPIITTGDYEVTIVNSNGDSHLFTHLSEDIFSRSRIGINNKYRSLQTLDNIDAFVAGKGDIILQGNSK